ncbi:hypothetical protein MKX47_11095 [Solibacillus sp. FSL R7-0668]|uniref:hypothetical protein n=1 Tax=Solibacillus sp. FSL R7-0668 TaxID=2921688 RepID=UPI0030FCBC96
MKRNKVIIFIISVIFLLCLLWILFPNNSAEVKSFTYEIEENNDELIFEVNYQFTNNTGNFSYATIVLDSLFYQRLKNPESIEPIFFNGGVSGSTRIIINKEDLTSDFIESVKSKERNPFHAISIGEEISL